MPLAHLIGISQGFISHLLITHFYVLLYHPLSSSLFSFSYSRTMIMLLIWWSVFCVSGIISSATHLIKSNLFTRYKIITVNIFIEYCENSLDEICLESPMTHRSQINSKEVLDLWTCLTWPKMLFERELTSLNTGECH